MVYTQLRISIEDGPSSLVTFDNPVITLQGITPQGETNNANKIVCVKADGSRDVFHTHVQLVNTGNNHFIIEPEGPRHPDIPILNPREDGLEGNTWRVILSLDQWEYPRETDPQSAFKKIDIFVSGKDEPFTITSNRISVNVGPSEYQHEYSNKVICTKVDGSQVVFYTHVQIVRDGDAYSIDFRDRSNVNIEPVTPSEGSISSSRWRMVLGVDKWLHASKTSTLPDKMIEKITFIRDLSSIPTQIRPTSQVYLTYSGRTSVNTMNENCASVTFRDGTVLYLLDDFAITKDSFDQRSYYEISDAEPRDDFKAPSAQHLGSPHWSVGRISNRWIEVQPATPRRYRIQFLAGARVIASIERVEKNVRFKEQELIPRIPATGNAVYIREIGSASIEPFDGYLSSGYTSVDDLDVAIGEMAETGSRFVLRTPHSEMDTKQPPYKLRLLDGMWLNASTSQTLDELEQTIEQLGQCNNHSSALQEQLNDEQRKTGELRARVAELETQLNDQHGHDQALAEVRKELVKVQEQLQQARRTVSDKEDEILGLQTRIAELEASISALQMRLQQAGRPDDEVIAECNATIASLQQQIVKLKQEVIDAGRPDALVEEEVRAQLNTVIDSLKKQRDDLNAKLRSNESVLAEMRSKMIPEDQVRALAEALGTTADTTLSDELVAIVALKNTKLVTDEAIKEYLKLRLKLNVLPKPETLVKLLVADDRAREAAMQELENQLKAAGEPDSEVIRQTVETIINILAIDRSFASLDPNTADPQTLASEILKLSNGATGNMRQQLQDALATIRRLENNQAGCDAVATNKWGLLLTGVLGFLGGRFVRGIEE